MLDRHQPLHFIGVGGIGMSALAGILAARGYLVSGSDPRNTPVVEALRRAGVTVFHEQVAETIQTVHTASGDPLVVISSAVPAGNAELIEARRLGLTVVHRSDILAALINSQPSIAVAGSHGKTTTSTLIATLLEATQQDPTAVIGGIVPAFASNGRHGEGRLLVAEADESDGSLVKFSAHLGLLTNIELDHTDHYPDLDALIATLQQFASAADRLLANRDDPILREHFEADHWWSTLSPSGVAFATSTKTAPWWASWSCPCPDATTSATPPPPSPPAGWKGCPSLSCNRPSAVSSPQAAASTAAASGRSASSSTTTPTTPARWMPP
jgi:UDP-N-acetylmuramate--alanine ligase